MSADDLRRKAHALRERARARALLSIASGTGVGIMFAWSAARAQALHARLGWAMLAAWAVYAVFRIRRWAWPLDLPRDETTENSAAFYRRELERQRDFTRHCWRRLGLTFCFLGLAILLVPALVNAGRGRLLNAAPFFVLLAVWAIFYTRERQRKQKLLQDEIAELDRFERGH